MNEIVTTAGGNDFDEAKEIILKIAEKNGGIISPRLIVDVARDEKNPLHGYFYWDDKIAGDRYRLNQASLLIRRIKIDIVKPTGKTKMIEIKPVRQFSSPASLRGKGGNGSYVRIEDVMKNDTLRADMLETAKKELIALKVKYENLTELSKVWEAIAEL
ncbi:MAG: hypothetical protein ABFD66_02115 [Smithella sp.]